MIDERRKKLFWIGESEGENSGSVPPFTVLYEDNSYVRYEDNEFVTYEG